jgi:hypothetical protein
MMRCLDCAYPLHIVEILRLDALDIPLDSLLDEYHFVPGLLVMHEIHRYALPSKPSRATCDYACEKP